MTTVNFTGLTKKLQALSGVSQAVMPKAFQYFENLTPLRKGNARASTHLNGNKIEAQYQYASVLDAGRGFRDGQMRGSIQAPTGMSQPTRTFIAQAVHQYIQSIGK